MALPGEVVHALEMPSRLPIGICALALLALAPGSAAAQSVTLGSPLATAPNLAIGCQTRPALVDTNGNYGPVPSGQADCTWRQTGVFGVLNSPVGSTAPATGRITSISVRSGPNPAPLRFVILRQLSQPGTGTACCFFVSETAPVQPQPNTVTTFQTNLPVERSTDVVQQIVTADFIGLSAASGTGTLPIATTGRNNLFDFTQPGSVNAGVFYPRLGAIPNDSGGGRHEDGIPGFEVLMQWTFTPAGAAPGGGGGPGGGGQGGAGVAAATAGDDTLTGTAAADRICGLAGSDTIDAGAGDDTVFGDACDVKARSLAGAAANGGNDTLSGSDGNDTLYGAGGNDKLNGGKGNDKLFGGGGTNSYAAGAGRDKVSARNGKRESIDCGPGRDMATVDKKDKVKGCEKVKRARK
jgi:hypothetical protein